MATSLRFYVQSITRTASNSGPGDGGAVVMAPSYANGKNSDWSKYTPSGKIELQVTGPAFAWFQDHLGKDLHIVIDDVPANDVA